MKYHLNRISGPLNFEYELTACFDGWHNHFSLEPLELGFGEKFLKLGRIDQEIRFPVE